MAATVIDGKAVAARVRAQVAEEVAAFSDEHGRVPGLATILVGDDPASAVYVGGKQKACAEVGMQGFNHPLPADTPQADVEALIERCNADPEISGILLQLPVPEPLDGVRLTGLIRADKDVDGLTAQSAGLLALGRRGLRPCTPDGMPMIGRARGRGDVWLATGHQMAGLKTAPGTGLLLAQLMTGETPRFDPEPFRADRY
jgi:methylenetetrahydrofolate dehydrogenase (NADP+)/methenyltetrahydrofolate cyclohydrolase